MRSLVEVSAATGVPLDSLAALEWNDIATYIDVLTPKPGRRGRGV